MIVIAEVNVAEMAGTPVLCTNEGSRIRLCQLIHLQTEAWPLANRGTSQCKVRGDRKRGVIHALDSRRRTRSSWPLPELAAATASGGGYVTFEGLEPAEPPRFHRPGTWRLSCPSARVDMEPETWRA